MGLFRRREREEMQAAPSVRDPRVDPRPVIDVNAPVRNPELLAALDAYERDPCDATLEGLTVALANGVYLAPVFISRDPETRPDGRTVFTEGTRFGFMSVAVPGVPDVTAFPACTDDEAFARCGAPEGFKMLVMEAKSVFRFGLSDGRAGVLLNPGSEVCLPVVPRTCRDVLRLLESG